MTESSNDQRIDYIEFRATHIGQTKEFYQAVFGWKFTDYGDSYTSFEDGRLSGGFHRDETIRKGGPLVVIYATDLEAVEQKIEGAGGTIVRPTFDFPEGRRFHFEDPSGNELAVWSNR